MKWMLLSLVVLCVTAPMAGADVYFEEELVAEKEQLKSILRSEGGGSGSVGGGSVAGGSVAGGSVAGGNRHKSTKRVKIKMPRSTRKQRE